VIVSTKKDSTFVDLETALQHTFKGTKTKRLKKTVPKLFFGIKGAGANCWHYPPPPPPLSLSLSLSIHHPCPLPCIVCVCAQGACWLRWDAHCFTVCR